MKNQYFSMHFFKPTLRFLKRTKTMFSFENLVSGHPYHTSELKNPMSKNPMFTRLHPQYVRRWSFGSFKWTSKMCFWLLECPNGPENMRNRLEIRFYTLAMLQEFFQLHLSSENHHFWFWVKAWWESIGISWYRLYSTLYSIHSNSYCQQAKTEKSSLLDC